MRTWQERLSAARSRSFVGRQSELAVFGSVMADNAVLFVHGPGGVGKSTLLDAFAQAAEASGRRPTRVDARHLPLGPQTLPVPAGPAHVLLIDTCELLEPVDAWLRESYLPALPEDTTVVFAGRLPPGPEWRSDPAWHVLMTELPMGNLTREDALSYLETQKVAPQLHDQLLATSHGHPLALSMLVDAVHRGTVPSSLDTVPEVVRALLERLIDEVPSPQHARALEVCAYAPATTQDLLTSVLGEAAGMLFAWLRALPFIEEGPRGLYPHDVVRDVLDADLLWRNPSEHAELGREVTRAMHSRLLATEDEREQLAFLVDQIVVSGRRSRAETCSTPPPTLQAYVDELKTEDHEPILAMTSHWHGPEQAGLVAYWLRRAPNAFRVFRTPAGVARGYAACLELTGEEAEDDVGADVMWQQAQARPGERVRAWRFFLDRDHGQQTSPSVTLFAACQVLDAITHPDVAYTLVGAHTDAARWSGSMANMDFWPVTAFSVGQHTFTVFAHDWRLVDRDGWGDRMRALHTGAALRPIHQDDRILLSRTQFTEAVRSALSHLNDPGQLQGNPLLRSRVTRAGRPDDASPVDSLRHLVHEAVMHLPADLKIIAEQTYLHPTTTQQRIAQSLHLSFNTDRRRRDQATEDITEWLWKRETLSAGLPSPRS